MKEEIKEKLLKGCGEKEERYGTIIYCGCLLKDNKTRNYCKTCQEKLKQHEETSKAKDEEFIKILSYLQDDVDALQIHHAKCEKVDVWELIEEIKQRIKEKEE